MVILTDLPIELLTHIVADVDTLLQNEEAVRDHALHNNRFSAVIPVPDTDSLPALRCVCRMISQICTPRLFGMLRVLPTPESAARYAKILESNTLNPAVRRVVFQTSMDTRGHDPVEIDSDDSDQEGPHDFFLEAMGKVGQFSNLTSAELVFAPGCASGEEDYFDDSSSQEQIDFREEVLVGFFAGLNHTSHPAARVRSLSIKNLQDMTPSSLMDPQDSEFRTNFRQVMSRVSSLSLQIATENNSAAPEHTLRIPEAHKFFGHELERYWLGPIRENLTYLKLYGGEMYWGYFPRCDLPKFPSLKTMILGNMSFTHDAQLDWILSHGATLEKLVMDDCPITVGARHIDHDFGPDRHVIRDATPSLENDKWPTWEYGARWHSHFEKIRKGLPKLKHFAFGHGPWILNNAFDEADSLTSSLQNDRYMYFDEGTGPSNWLEPGYEECFNEGDDEEDLVYKPKCDEEDQQSLDALLDETRTRQS